ncbi:hypothetical protein LRY60_05020 [Candidatus Woesebacteria bacterium]|nr:hypothetical protein [Candidatus Woesebacteria bacterium]
MKSPEQGITTPLTAETVKNIRARFEKFAQGHVGVTIFSGPDLGNMQIEAEGEISVLNMENAKSILIL